MSEQELKNRFLKVIIHGQLLIESNDRLEGTQMFKHQLKQTTKRNQQELEKAINHRFDNVFDAGEDSVRTIMNSIDDIAQSIIDIPLEDIANLSNHIKQYNSKINYT